MLVHGFGKSLVAVSRSLSINTRILDLVNVSRLKARGSSFMFCGAMAHGSGAHGQYRKAGVPRPEPGPGSSHSHEP